MLHPITVISARIYYVHKHPHVYISAYLYLTLPLSLSLSLSLHTHIYMCFYECMSIRVQLCAYMYMYITYLYMNAVYFRLHTISFLDTLTRTQSKHHWSDCACRTCGSALIAFSHSRAIRAKMAQKLLERPRVENYAARSGRGGQEQRHKPHRQVRSARGTASALLPIHRHAGRTAKCAEPRGSGGAQ